MDFSDAPKRATNLSLNSGVLDMARELKMNISQTVNRLLADEVRRRYVEHWVEENKEAIEEYNARVERDGLFSARYRNFMRPPRNR